MDSEDRALRVRARRTRRAGERGAIALPDDHESPGTAPEHLREAEEYARRTMISSARAHDRAATLLEGMATAHPEEAELHLKSAARHRRWADNDRSLAQRYAPRSSEPDGV